VKLISYHETMNRDYTTAKPSQCN